MAYWLENLNSISNVIICEQTLKSQGWERLSSLQLRVLQLLVTKNDLHLDKVMGWCMFEFILILTALIYQH